MEIPVKQLILTPEQQGKLSKYIADELTRCYRERKNLEESWEIWSKQYSGRLSRDDKTETWQPDFDIGVTRELAFQQEPRIVNTILQQDKVMICTPRETVLDQQEVVQQAKQTEEFLDYDADSFDLEDFLRQAVRNAQIYKYSVAKSSSESGNKRAKVWQGDGSPRFPYEEVEIAIESGEKIVSRILHTPDCVFPSEAVTADTAAWIGERFRLTEAQFKYRVKNEGWVGTEAPSTDEGAEKAENDAKGIVPDPKGVYYELYLNPGVCLDGDWPDAIINCDQQGTLYRVIENYHHDEPIPYTFLHYRKALNSLFGEGGLCADLEPYHRALSAIFIAKLEAAALGNATCHGFSDPLVVSKLKGRRLRPGENIQFSTKPSDSYVQINLSNPAAMSALDGVASELYSHAQKLAGITDYNFGIEQIQRPTASGQTMLVEEGKQPLYEFLAMVRAFLANVFHKRLLLYSEHYPGSVPYYPTVDGAPQLDAIHITPEILYGGLIIETKASSANMNESVRKQEMVGLMQQWIPFVTQTAQMATQAVTAAQQGSPVALILGQAVDVNYAFGKRFLSAFNVPLPAEINPQFGGTMAAAQQLGGVIEQLKQQNMQLMQAVQQLSGGQGGPGMPPGPPGAPPVAPPNGLPPGPAGQPPAGAPQ